MRLKCLFFLLNKVCNSPFRLLRFHLNVFSIFLLFLLALTAITLLSLFGEMADNWNVKSEGDVNALANLEAIDSTATVFIFCS